MNPYYDKQCRYKASSRETFSGKPQVSTEVKRALVFFVIVFSFLLLFHYSCHHISPITLPSPTHPPPPTLNPPPPLSLSMAPLYLFLDLTLPLLSPISPLPPPLWSLSVCSLHERQLSLGSKKNSKLGVYNGLDVTGFSRFDFHLQVFVLNGNVNVIKAKFFVSTFPCNKQGGHSV